MLLFSSLRVELGEPGWTQLNLKRTALVMTLGRSLAVAWMSYATLSALRARKNRFLLPSQISNYKVSNHKKELIYYVSYHI